MNKLIIIGAGGHGRVVADCAEQLNTYDEILFLDDCYPKRNNNAHWKIIGQINAFNDLLAYDFIVALGVNSLRQKVTEQLKAQNAKLATLIHPSAIVSPSADIAEGVVVFANAVINIGSQIGQGCIINTGATVDHDCLLGNYVHICPGVNLAGGVQVGKLSWVGIGSNVIQYANLAENIQIGAGATVIKAEHPNYLYLGVPAKPIKIIDNF